MIDFTKYTDDDLRTAAQTIRHERALDEIHLSRVLARGANRQDVDEAAKEIITDRDIADAIAAEMSKRGLNYGDL